MEASCAARCTIRAATVRGWAPLGTSYSFGGCREERLTIGGLVAVVMLTPRLATAQSLSSDILTFYFNETPR
jgi:hypothetical protein